MKNTLLNLLGLWQIIEVETKLRLWYINTFCGEIKSGENELLFFFCLLRIPIKVWGD